MEELLGALLLGTVAAWAYREMRGRNGHRPEARAEITPRKKSGKKKARASEEIEV